MIYQEFLPPQQWQYLIECFWVAKGSATDLFRPVFPDGCMDIIFNFGGAIEIRRTVSSSINKEHVFVVGNMTCPVFSRSADATDLLGVRFKAGGLSSFISAPLAELTDRTVPFRDLRRADFLLDEIRDSTDKDRIEHVSRFLMSQFQGNYNDSWRDSLHAIIHSREFPRVHALATHMGISQKQLERKFKENVGLTPKQLIQVLRFRRLAKTLAQKPEGSLADIAFDQGFTDPAHVTKFFRSFAEMTPGEYRSSFF